MKKSASKIEIKKLRADCENCFGLCCVALYFSKSEGFPTDKEPGSPCPNLRADFKCKVHQNLREKGFKGCCAFDCYGAGAKIASHTFKGQDWMNHPEKASEIFEAFLIMRQLHEILWYLNQASTVQIDETNRQGLFTMIEKIEKLTELEADKLLQLQVSDYRTEANACLQNIKDKVISGISDEKIEAGKRKIKYQLDWIGKDLRKMDLRGADFRGSYLMAANLSGTNLNGADFIGADLRDTDLRGADLSECLFLTQAQVNVAKGDKATKLPTVLDYPGHWI